MPPHLRHTDARPSVPGSQQQGACFCANAYEASRSRYKICTFVVAVGVFDFAVSHIEQLLCCICDMEDFVCNYYLSDKDLKPHQAAFHVGSL